MSDKIEMEQWTGELDSALPDSAPVHKPSCDSNFLSICGDSQRCDCGATMPVVAPGDLRARIEQLRLDDSDIVPGTDALITVSYNRAIADVLALLGAAQEQP